MFGRRPTVEQSFPEQDLLCALAALSEGATWQQIYEMFPGKSRAFDFEVGRFLRKWVPDWSPSLNRLDPACMCAAIRNYIWTKNRVFAEWMAN